MLTNQTQSAPPGTSASHKSGFPGAPLGATATIRPSIPTARNLACLGSTLKVSGEISSDEDLQIDGMVEGTISVQGHKLIVGPTAMLNSEVTAGGVIVYGKVTGNIHTRDRVEIKKDGSVFGDITAARISIEDGADFKGRIEIDRLRPQTNEDSSSVGVPAAAEII